MNAPAGFWRRYAAYSLDLTIVAVLASPLLVPRLRAGRQALMVGIDGLQRRIWELFEAGLADAGFEDMPDPLTLAGQWASDPALRAGLVDLAALLVSILVGCIGVLVAVAAVWFVGFEASRWRATPGKRVLGIEVATVDGARPSPARIVLRFVAAAPSWLLLNIGHAMAGWNRDRRALHDFIAGTRVQLADGASAAMPRWALSWMLLQAALFCALCAWVLFAYAQMLVAAGIGG